MSLLISVPSLFLFGCFSSSLFLSLPPSTYTDTNKHSCHSGLLLRASESPQMGTAKCRCHSASVPKKQGHLLWSQVTTGHLHMHTHAQTYTHKLVSTQTCKVQKHTTNANRHTLLCHCYGRRVTRPWHLHKVKHIFKSICLRTHSCCCCELWAFITHIYTSIDYTWCACVCMPLVMSGCTLNWWAWGI